MNSRPPAFQFDFSKLYRIWFSANPHQFLGLENMKRLERMRKDNPQQEITLVYYARGLTDKAKTELTSFCKKQRIKALDFDDIKSWLIHKNDKTLYAIARKEIEKSISKQGGNLAAASDCTRIILPVIEKLGTYTDFDVECFFHKLPSTKLCTDAPIILNGNLVTNNNRSLFYANTDFLAFASHQIFSARLAPEAATEIRQIQSAIIDNYQDKFSENIFATLDILSDAQKNIISQFQQQHNQQDIFSFRQFILKGMNEFKHDKIMLNNYEYLYQIFVIRMSGPDNYIHLYSLTSDDPLNEVKKSCLTNQPILSSCVIAQNDDDTLQHEDDFYQHADISWAPSGAAAKSKRETEMAAIIIQSFFRMKKARHQFIAEHGEPTKKASNQNSTWFQDTCHAALNACRYVTEFAKDHPSESALLILGAVSQLVAQHKGSATIGVSHQIASNLRKRL
jgi:Glycosyltransferase family 88/IQ calmodulin-binding motif